ncbi:PD-(D/E)XK nuclease family protein [Nonomuraea sp. NPDC050556]|uniref:PD-(D/E)XK nuclease family protein n=1 Tax=Nonomuraea sp. NPDC050556 TaxID=3364369 RepID=UPI0037936D36
MEADFLLTRTSVSRVTGIARCGTAYELERVERLPQLQAGWTMQGIAIHEACDAWEKSGRTMPTVEAQEIFSATWRAELSKADERWPDRDQWLVGGRKKVLTDLRDRFTDGLSQVADYIDYNLADPTLIPYVWPDGTIASEIGFEEPFGGALVRGYIDLVMQDPATGRISVRDIKSGSKPPAVPFQLIVYARALTRLLDEEVAWGHFFMTKHRKPTPPTNLATLDEAWIERWFERQVLIEQQGLFLPNPGDACRTCSVSPHCPLMNL